MGLMYLLLVRLQNRHLSFLECSQEACTHLHHHRRTNLDSTTSSTNSDLHRSLLDYSHITVDSTTRDLHKDLLEQMMLLLLRHTILVSSFDQLLSSPEQLLYYPD